MARYPIQGTFLDGNGRRIEGGTVSFFLADTTTPADVYAAKSGGATINTVLSDSTGGFIAYVDEGDYASSQLFDLTLAKTNFITKNVYDIAPFSFANNIDVGDLADGTDGELITWDSSGESTTVAVGTTNQVLTSKGTGAVPEWSLPVTTKAQAALGNLTGNSTTFTDIPATVKLIQLAFRNLSFDASDNLLIQLNSITTNYLGSYGHVVNAAATTASNMTDGFRIFFPNASTVLFGIITLSRGYTDGSNNIWIVSGQLGNSAAATIHYTAGAVDIGATPITSLTFKSAGASNFDNNAAVAIFYSF